MDVQRPKAIDFNYVVSARVRQGFETERAARRALVLTAIGDRSGARSAWDLAREGAWTDHATRSSEALR